MWVPTKESNRLGNRLNKPWIVIECKKRDEYLTEGYFKKGKGYCKKLDAPILVLTNGDDTRVYMRGKRHDYQPIEDIPKYEDLIRKRRIPQTMEVTDEVMPRPTFEMLSNAKWLRKTVANTYGDRIIGVDSPKYLWPLVIDMQHLLRSPNPFFTSPIRWKGFVFIEDLRVSSHSFGNAGGGAYPGEYRSFLILDNKGNHHVIRFILSATEKHKNDPMFGTRKGITCFNVAVCNGENMHNSLQLRLDTNVNKVVDSYHFTHDGRLTNGNLGGVKNQIVIDYIREHESSLVDGNKIWLGEVVHKELLRWCDVKDLILNMAVYALLRDDLRAELKNHTSSANF